MRASHSGCSSWCSHLRSRSGRHGRLQGKLGFACDLSIFSLSHPKYRRACIQRYHFLHGPRDCICNHTLLPTSRGGNSRCQPRHAVQTLNRDTLCLALLREHRRNAGEARRPFPIYACEWWDSRGVLRRHTHKQPYSIEPARYYCCSTSVSQRGFEIRTAGNATSDDASHRYALIEKPGLLLGLDLDA